MGQPRQFGPLGVIPDHILNSAYFWFAANCRRQASQRQSAYWVRSSASVVESKRIVSHQHPISCWQVKGCPQREHFFSTAAGTDGFRIPFKIGMAKSTTHCPASNVLTTSSFLTCYAPNWRLTMLLLRHRVARSSSSAPVPVACPKRAENSRPPLPAH